MSAFLAFFVGLFLGLLATCGFLVWYLYLRHK